MLTNKTQNVTVLLSLYEYIKLKQGLLRYDTRNSVDPTFFKNDSKTFDTLCKKMWKNINSYLALRKTRKSPDGHIEKMLHYGMKGSLSLDNSSNNGNNRQHLQKSNLRNTSLAAKFDLLSARDETYVQFCKQTRNNNDVDCLINAWQLMTVCCSIFPPSQCLCEFLCVGLCEELSKGSINLAKRIQRNDLQSWFNGNTSLSKLTINDMISLYACYSIQSSDCTMGYDAQKCMPLQSKIHQMELLQAISIDIYYINGIKCFTSLFNAQTTINQIIDTLNKNLGIKFSETFGLYEMELSMNSNLIKTSKFNDKLKDNHTPGCSLDRGAWQNNTSNLNSICKFTW